MTITIGFWFWPAALAILGLLVAVVSVAMDDSPSYGIGTGCLGIMACAALWLAAAALAIGRYFA